MSSKVKELEKLIKNPKILQKVRSNYLVILTRLNKKTISLIDLIDPEFNKIHEFILDNCLFLRQPDYSFMMINVDLLDKNIKKNKNFYSKKINSYNKVWDFLIYGSPKNMSEIEYFELMGSMLGYPKSAYTTFAQEITDCRKTGKLRSDRVGFSSSKNPQDSVSIIGYKKNKSFQDVKETFKNWDKAYLNELKKMNVKP